MTKFSPAFMFVPAGENTSSPSPKPSPDSVSKVSLTQYVILVNLVASEISYEFSSILQFLRVAFFLSKAFTFSTKRP